MRVDNGGNGVVIHHRFLAGDTLGRHHALFHTLVRKHRATNRITHGVYAGGIGFTDIVDEDEAALIEIHAAVGCQQAFGEWPAADRDDELVELLLLLPVRIGEGDLHLLVLDL